MDNQRGISSPPNLFVIGMPRSGTKLLRTLLNNHSKIFIPDFELVMLPKLIKKYGASRLSSTEVNNIISDVKRSIFFFYYLKDNKFDFSRLRQGRSAREIISLLLWQLADNDQENVYLGDKSPGNINHAKILIDYYPDAKFIHIVRDPRDYALSVKKAWNKSILRSVVRWTDSIAAFNTVSRAHPDKVLEIKYEDLLEFPGQTLERCTRFLDLEFEPSMEVLDASVENLGDARSTFIVSDNRSKYISGMSQSLSRKVEDCTVSFLDYYGYPHQSERSKNKKISSVVVFALFFYDAINVLRFNFKEFGAFDGLKKVISVIKSTA